MPRPPGRAFGPDFCADSLLCSLHGMGFPGVNDLFNIVSQAVKHPLDIDLVAQGEPVLFLTCANVSEARALPTVYARGTCSTRAIINN